MIITHNIAPYVVFAEDSILSALQKITDNKARLVFCVSEHGVLLAVLSDGDVRRWIASQSTVDLSRPVIEAANRTFVSAPERSSPADLVARFSTAITEIPLLDDRGRIVSIASNRSAAVPIGPFSIGPGFPALLIAEIGINHNGSVELAKQLVDEAVHAGADCVKFQLRDLATLYRNEPGQLIAGEDLGPQYTLDLLTRFSLPADQLTAVFDHCRTSGVTPLCTPWDLESVRALDEYGIDGYKVASADLTNHEVLEAIAAAGGPVLLSTGMSTEAEIIESIGLLRRLGAPVVPLHCNSTYPAPFKDINLAYLERLAEIAGGPVGYSGHERGYHVAVAAVARGAKVIEKHFTLDKALEGNDHKVSLLPDEFSAMTRAIRDVEEALGTAQPRAIGTGEMMNRINLAKSLVAAQPIQKGVTITSEMVTVRSPGRGLQPNQLKALLGSVANRSLPAGEYFYPSDLAGICAKPRPYRFHRPWGLPVRYHDFRRLLEGSNPDFLEFHLSYNDLDIDPEAVFDEPLDLDLTVHSPDLFRGDHLLNLAASNDDYRKRSIAELQRVIDLARSMTRWFTRAAEPIVIVSMGGFSKEAPLPPGRCGELYECVANSLQQLDTAGVRVVAQTLPPFPWYLGGQLHCNLFVCPDDTARFCIDHDVMLCLDVSHTKLAANHLRLSFSEVIDQLAPFAEHLHLVDARGIDGEGLQIGEGEIDFAVLAQQLDRLAPRAGFIPEIWQGHVNDGEAFWLANERLEEWF